jgi:hypothetical protein
VRSCLLPRRLSPTTSVFRGYYTSHRPAQTSCRLCRLVISQRQRIIRSHPLIHFAITSYDMDHPPPFDPPFSTAHQSAEGMRITETLADRSTRDITSTSQGRCVINVLDMCKSGASGNEASTPARKPASATKAAPGNARAALLLTVPFAEKDNAKALGAKWDAAAKKWYVPQGLDINLFESWWPDSLKQK